MRPWLGAIAVTVAFFLAVILLMEDPSDLRDRRGVMGDAACADRGGWHTMEFQQLGWAANELRVYCRDGSYRVIPKS